MRAGKRLRLGASAGAAVFPHDGATYEALLADADHRMYRDKAARRGHGPLTDRSAAAGRVRRAGTLRHAAADRAADRAAADSFLNDTVGTVLTVRGRLDRLDGTP